MRVCQAPDFSIPALATVLSEVQPDLVIHLAAAGVTGGGQDLDQLLAVNVDFTLNLIRAAATTCRPRILHTGSCFEYAATSDAALTEQHPIAPFSFYGASKAASVHLATTLARQLDLPLIVLRLFGVYGPSEAASRLIPSLVRELLANRPIQLTSGQQERDLLFEDDAAEAILSASLQFDTFPQHAVFNVGSDVATRIRDVGDMVATELNRPAALLCWGARPPRVGEPLRIVANSQPFRALTGWQPRHDLHSGIRRTVSAAVVANASRAPAA